MQLLHGDDRRRVTALRAGAAVTAVALGLALAAALAVAATAPGDRVLEGVAVDGHDVGGLTHAELEDTVERLAADRLDEPVVVRGERDSVELTSAEAGLEVDHAGAVEAAWARGREVPSGWWERIAARFGATTDVALAEQVDAQRLDAAAAEAADTLSVASRDADVSIRQDDGEPVVDVTEPAEGEQVDAELLRERLGDAVASPGASEVDAPGELVEPAIGDADLDAVVDEAHTAVSAPVELTHPAGGDDLVLDAGELAGFLDVEQRPDAVAGERLALTVDREAFQDAVADRAPQLDVEPVEATIDITDGEVQISGGTAGYHFDPDAVAEQVLAVATRPDNRTETLAGPQPQPELTRADAEELGIVEEVSSFTTNYDCCPPRVTNIQLMAEIVDGALIRPGERFSLNDHAGPRTEERGFVGGGAIIDGEFEEVVGGGSSQFATTFFNAAFFSGVDLVAFQPHSYYFPRYPAGRESTISYNVIDVVIENDSPHGILVESSATDTSVTVAFWSSPWAEVEAFDSGPYNVVPGAQRDGFDIDFGRVVTYPDGSTEREEWFHRYEPQD